MGVENLAPTRIRSVDHPARNESLSRPTQVYNLIFILLIQSDDCYFVAETCSCSLPVATVKLYIHGCISSIMCNL